MRINGPGRPGASQAGTGPRRTGAGGGPFVPAGGEPQPRAGSAPAAAGALSGLDALLALQSVDVDRPPGRRGAVRRGHALLDVLERIRVDLLSGGVSGAALDRVADLLSDIEQSGDPDLDSLVADIALRAEVELAKLGRFLHPS